MNIFGIEAGVCNSRIFWPRARWRLRGQNAHIHATQIGLPNKTTGKIDDPLNSELPRRFAAMLSFVQIVAHGHDCIARPNVFTVALAGHGFKFAPVPGEIMADMLEGKNPTFDVARFSPERFD